MLWSISPFFFTGAGRRIGPFATNLMRLALAIALLLLITGIRALISPESLGMPSLSACLWLAASGAVGLALGDFFLYRCMVLEGPERSSLFMTLAPAATAVMAWVGLKELLSGPQIGGMALVLAGVTLATWPKAGAKPEVTPDIQGAPVAETVAAATGPETPLAAARAVGKLDRRINPWMWMFFLSGPMTGIWSALLQGLGTVFARQAFLSQPDLDPILATTLRIGAGAATLWAWARAMGPLRPILGNWRRPDILRMLLLGTLAGPVLGMLCYVAALKFTVAGVVTTITFMSPLLVLPMGAWHYGTRIGPRTVLGAMAAVAGVGLLGRG